MSRIFGVPVLTFFLCLLSFTSGCSRSKTAMDRGLRLEQQGRPDKALQLYEAQVEKTPPSDRTTLAELQFRIGESFLHGPRP
jgi:hypothetical protein